MSKNNVVLIVGITFFIMPFLAFPSAWKNFLLIVLGLLLVLLSLWSSIHERLSLPSFQVKKTQEGEKLFVDGHGPEKPVDVTKDTFEPSA